MKKIFAALAASVMLLGGAVTAFAEGELIPNEYYTANTKPDERQKPLLMDDADILSDSEEEKLLDKLERISSEHGIDVAVVTTYSLGDRTPMEFADDYYDYNGFSEDGFVLLLSMEERDRWISTSGTGIEIYTDYGQDYMWDQILPELKADKYYDAFDEYADLSEQFIKEWEKGTPYDTNHKVKGKLAPIWILIALGGGGLIGLIYAQAVKGQLTSVAMQHGADDYIRRNSFKVTDSRDNFLYRNVQREYIPPAEKSSGGGSSTHTSHSGSSHGGSGGKF